jgi:hypothetical protein
MAHDAQGRYIRPDEPLPTGEIASASRNSNSNGSAFDTPDPISLIATLTATDRNGTSPTLDVELQTSGDDGSTFEKVGQFTLSNLAPGDIVATRVGDVITLTAGGTLAATNIAQLTSDPAGLTATDLTAEVKVFGPLGSKCRWAWTIGGSASPDFTFAVSNVLFNRDG